MKVAPEPTLRVAAAARVPHQAMFPARPFAVLGAPRVPPLITDAVAPSARTCFGPRGAALMPNGALWICDTGHHRLLGWRSVPDSDDVPADWIIGQPDFFSEGRNGKASVHAASVNVPTGICAYAQGMAVADSWNHRVLIWQQVPEASHVPADIVLGQTSMFMGESNSGKASVCAASFHWPYGVASSHDQLFVADSENRRVLVWHTIPRQNGQSADLVLGQRDFTSRDDNAGSEPSAMSMRWPHGITFWKDMLCVADAGNNRIMVWRALPDCQGAACDFVLGQRGPTQVDHNQSLYWPRENVLNMPYAVSARGDWLLVADTANSRVLGFHYDDLASDAPARALFGQPDFHSKGDNRWQPAQADSVCWPYGLDVKGDTVAITDTGNNRISLWKLAL